MPLARRTIQYGSIRKPGGGRHARCREARAAGAIGAGASGGSITDADNPVLCKRLERIDRPIASSFSQTLHGSDSSMSGSLTVQVADDPGTSTLAAAVTRTRPYDISTGGEAAA